MKVHIGAGDIYLQGYVNCDLHGTLVSEGGDPSHNITTLDKYFDRYPFGTPPRPFVIDKRMNALERWPFDDYCADQIVTISFIEHFPKSVLENHIIPEVERILKPGGKWIVDFPNLKGTFEQYFEKDHEFCMRLIYCNGKNNESHHYWGYTEETFKRMLFDRWDEQCPSLYSWDSVQPKIYVKHDYPTLSMECIKA